MKIKHFFIAAFFCTLSVPTTTYAIADPAAELTPVHYRYSPYHSHRHGYSKYHYPGNYSGKYGYYKPRRYYRHAYPKRHYYSRGYRHRYYR